MQFLQDGGVGFGEAVIGNFSARDPAPALAFEALRGDVSRKKDVVEVEDDFRATVTVIVVSECFAFKRKAEFFAQFAQKRRFVALTGFDFAAGKFPVTRPGLVRRTSAMRSWPCGFSMMAATTLSGIVMVVVRYGECSGACCFRDGALHTAERSWYVNGMFRQKPAGAGFSGLCQFAVAVFEAFAGAAGAGVVAAGAGDFFRGGFA